MRGISDIVRYLGTFVAVLLVVVSLGGLYNSLRGTIAIFEGIAIALLSVSIILLMTLYYKIEQLSVPRGRKR